MGHRQVTGVLTGAALTFALLGGPALANDPAQACMDCHGKDGISTESDVPIIAGASSQYLIDSMQSYREKKRPCPTSAYRAGDTKRPKTDMCKLAASLTAEDIKQVAAFYSAKPFVPAKQQVDAKQAAIGQKLHKLNCEKCHADGGSSADDDAGVLAGQWMPYLRETFKDYMDGARPMPLKMEPKLEKLNAQDIEALIHYYGSQQ